MADRRITEFSEIASGAVADGDIVPIVRIAGGTTDGANRKISVAALRDIMQGDLPRDIAELNIRFDQVVIASSLHVGTWSASSGAFPTTRPGGAPIRSGDLWSVDAAGTVDGVFFDVGSYLQAIVDGGGATFEGNWGRFSVNDFAEILLETIEARDKAEEWATQTVDVPVETGPSRYSAFHHATKAADSADAASSSAGAAATARGGAEAARDTTAGYASAAGTAANFYATIALGRAAVADGETFGVVAGGSDGLTRPTLYRRDTSSTQTLIVALVPGAAMDTQRNETMAQRGNVAASTDLSTIWLPGIYQILANGSYTAVPTGFIADRAYWLRVSNYGGTGGAGNGRFVQQELIEQTARAGGREWWVRGIDTNSPSMITGQRAWERIPTRPDGERYIQRGVLPPGTDLGLVRAPGVYQLPANGSHIGMPPDADPTLTYWLDVSNPGVDATGAGAGRFSLQRLTAFAVSNPLTVRAYRPTYERRLDANFPDATEANAHWLPVHPGAVGAFAGRMVVALGDSVTEGTSTYRWPPLFQARTGATTINGGFGGCRMANHNSTAPTTNDPSKTIGEVYDPMCMHRIADRIADQDWEVLTDAADVLYAAQDDDNRPQAAALAGTDWDAVTDLIIAYGTNDFAANIPLGAPTDVNRTTFRGAINHTIQTILTARPTMRIVMVTPIWRSRVFVDGDDSNVTPNAGSLLLRAYAEAIIEQAARYQIPVIDANLTGGFNILNWSALMPDGLHPYSAAGMGMLADRIAAGFEAVS